MPLKSQLLKNLFILLFLVIICILFSCQKGNSNKPASTTSNIPSSIIYQDLDTTTGNYITTQTFYLFPDSAGIYFDSVHIIDAATSNFTSIVLNHGLFNSKKYLFYINTFPNLDSNEVSVIKFDNNNRIMKLHDHFSLLLDQSIDLDNWSNNGIDYNNFASSDTVLSSFSTILSNIASVIDMSYNFDVKDANSDSMKIESGINHDQGFYDRAIKYTVYFDNNPNNTNLIQLSGYLYDNSLAIGSTTSYIYDLAKKIPFPNLKMKLVKSIYISEYLGNTLYGKYVDFTYEYDNENRITKATIKTYYIDYSGVIYPNYITTKRILFTY